MYCRTNKHNLTHSAAADTDEKTKKKFTKQCLSLLEQKNSISRPIIGSQPAKSSFFWIDSSKLKHKAYISTRNREFFFSLEEFDFNKIKKVEIDDRWWYAKRSIKLAVSETIKEDRRLCYVLFDLMRMMSNTDIYIEEFHGNTAYAPNRPTIEINQKKLVTQYTLQICKIVKDGSEERCEKVFFKRIQTVTALDTWLINSVNDIFDEVARHFAACPNHVVYHY